MKLMKSENVSLFLLDDGCVLVAAAFSFVDILRKHKAVYVVFTLLA